MKTLIIGGVAAGASAAARLRRLDESMEIVLLERGRYISYANCGLPYYIGGIQRLLYQFLLYFLPQGQCFQIAFLGLERPELCLGGTGLFLVLTTTLGLALFHKKDIK